MSTPKVVQTHNSTLPFEDESFIDAEEHKLSQNLIEKTTAMIGNMCSFILETNQDREKNRLRMLSPAEMTNHFLASLTEEHKTHGNLDQLKYVWNFALLLHAKRLENNQCQKKSYFGVEVLVNLKTKVMSIQLTEEELMDIDPK